MSSIDLPKSIQFKAPRRLSDGKEKRPKRRSPQSLLQPQSNFSQSSSPLPTSSGTVRASSQTVRDKLRSSSCLPHQDTSTLELSTSSPTLSSFSALQDRMRSSLSPDVDSGLNAAASIASSLSELENQVNKILGVLTFDVCARPETKKAVKAIVDLADAIKDGWTVNADDSLARRTDALATVLWNGLLAFKATLRECPRSNVLHTIASLRYSSVILLFISRTGEDDFECSSEVMLACSRTAIDLFAADRTSLGNDVMTMISKQIAEDSKNVEDQARAKLSLTYNESRTLYWIARCVMARKNGAGGASEYLNKALSCSSALPKTNNILTEVITEIQVIALQRLESCKAQDSGALQLEELKESSEQLQEAIGSCERRLRLTNDQPPPMMLDLMRMYARTTLHIAWQDGSDEGLKRAQNCLWQVFKRSKEVQQDHSSACKDGLLLLLVMEHKVSALDAMLKIYQLVIDAFIFDDECVTCLCNILEKTSRRQSENDISRYILTAVKIFLYRMAASQTTENKISAWSSRIVTIALNAIPSFEHNLIRDLLQTVEKSGIPVLENTAEDWLNLIVGKFQDLDETVKAQHLDLLALAKLQLWQSSTSTVVGALKIAIYYALQSGQLRLARNLLAECSSFPDAILTLMDCSLGIREHSEEYANRAMDFVEGPSEVLPKDMLMALLDEAQTHGMTSVAHRIMHILLKDATHDSHTIDRLIMLRAAVKAQVEVLQRGQHEENFHSEFRKLEELVDLSRNAFAQAIEEDNTNEEKAAECDWMANFLYCFVQDVNNHVHLDQQIRTCSMVKMLMQVRLQFAVEVAPDLLRINLWASITLLTGEILASESSEPTEANTLAIVTAADVCQEALALTEARCDAGHDYNRYKTVILIAKAEALLKSKAYDKFMECCLPEAKGSKSLSFTDLEDIATLLSEYTEAPIGLLVSIVMLMLEGANQTSSFDATVAAKWVHCCLKGYEAESGTRLVYVDVIHFLNNGIVRCLQDTRTKPQIRWPGEVLVCIGNDLWQMGFRLMNEERRLEAGLQVLQIAVDIEAYASCLPHKTKQSRLDLVNDLRRRFTQEQQS